jgi:hypothetical protein
MAGRRLGVCVALGVSMLAAGVANAAALAKFKDWCAWPNPGTTVYENPQVDGVAILKYKQQTDVATLNVVVHRLLPNTAYAVYLFDDGGGPDVLFGQASQQFTTDEDGSGTFQGETLSGMGMPATPRIYILRVPAGPVANWDDLGSTGDPIWVEQIRAHSLPVVQ